MLYLILLTALFIIIVSSFRKGTDIYSPARVFGVVWIVAICLTELKFSRFQFDWNWYSWLVVVSPIVSFLIGTFIGYVLNMGKPLLSVKSIRSITQNNKFNTDVFFYGLLVFYAAYIISFIVQYFVEGAVPLFSKHTDYARVEYGIFGFNLIVIGGWLLMFLCIEFFILTSLNKQKKNQKLIVLFIGITTFLSYLTLLQRFPLMILITMFLSFAYYGSRLYKPRVLISLGLIVFLLFQAIQSVRVSQYVTAYHYVISQMKYPKKYAAFTEPYMYIVMNLENSAWAAKTVEKFSYGAMNFDWLLAITQLKHPLIEYFSLDQQMNKVAAYNTFSFIWYFYSDFGVFGITVLPILVGMLISFIYYRMRQTGELNWIVAYSFAFYWMLISFFTNPLFSLNIVTHVLILWIFHKVIKLNSSN